MEENESETVMRTDLLSEDEVLRYIKKIEDAKSYIIYAATGQVEINDSCALEHLKDLNYLQDQLSSLHKNLKAELITFDHEKAWGKFD